MAWSPPPGHYDHDCCTPWLEIQTLGQQPSPGSVVGLIILIPQPEPGESESPPGNPGPEPCSKSGGSGAQAGSLGPWHGRHGRHGSQPDSEVPGRDLRETATDSPAVQ